MRASPWIGRGRAQVIIVNVVLPFAAAAGVAEAGPLFERFPGEPSNRVVRYMAEQLGGPAVRFRGACHQQGLLHLFNLTCAGRLCERGPAHVPGNRRNNNTNEAFDRLMTRRSEPVLPGRLATDFRRTARIPLAPRLPARFARCEGGALFPLQAWQPPRRTACTRAQPTLFGECAHLARSALSTFPSPYPPRDRV